MTLPYYYISYQWTSGNNEYVAHVVTAKHPMEWLADAMQGARSRAENYRVLFAAPISVEQYESLVGKL